ncbi:hypothetical protein COB11_03625 [Candidatus Aerophobetes bacterium]|uniref:Uncharacterized protein n=1 Tax=Aerophobetes bacterium TaxID=2030807 RepID=A0A2A4YJ59_UNCAE|nr:MAG: hypothetical protein COB11_03625 [Candidatus Aerophobetes bacterium]
MIPPIARNQFDNRVFLDVPCGEVTDQVFMLFAKAMLYYLETTLRKDGFECEGLFVQSGLQENSASENTF